MGHTNLPSGFRRRGDNLVAFFRRDRHRLLDDHVRPGPQSFDSQWSMGLRRCTNVDKIKLQHQKRVLIGSRNAEATSHLATLNGACVAQCDNVSPTPQLLPRRQVLLRSDKTRSDQPDSIHMVWRLHQQRK